MLLSWHAACSALGNPQRGSFRPGAAQTTSLARISMIIADLHVPEIVRAAADSRACFLVPPVLRPLRPAQYVRRAVRLRDCRSRRKDSSNRCAGLSRRVASLHERKASGRLFACQDPGQTQVLTDACRARRGASTPSAPGGEPRRRRSGRMRRSPPLFWGSQREGCWSG